jgi:hypothetical protein
MRVAIVGCGKTKDPRPVALPARDRYTSPLFRKSLELAERTADVVYIASALHELLEPGRPIVPYSHSLAGAGKREREAWGERVVSRLVERHWATVIESVTIYAGADYYEPIARALGFRRPGGIPTIRALGNLQIGQRLAELNRQLGAARAS